MGLTSAASALGEMFFTSLCHRKACAAASLRDDR